MNKTLRRILFNPLSFSLVCSLALICASYVWRDRVNQFSRNAQALVGFERFGLTLRQARDVLSHKCALLLQIRDLQKENARIDLLSVELKRKEAAITQLTQLLKLRRSFASLDFVGIAPLRFGARRAIVPSQHFSCTDQQMSFVLISLDGVVGRGQCTPGQDMEVTLVNDINMRLAVVIESPNGSVRAITHSGVDSSVGLDFYTNPPASALKSGARVLTSGDDDFFPSGVLVGSLKHSASGSWEIDLTVSPHNAGFVGIYFDRRGFASALRPPL